MPIILILLLCFVTNVEAGSLLLAGGGGGSIFTCTASAVLCDTVNELVVRNDGSSTESVFDATGLTICGVKIHVPLNNSNNGTLTVFVDDNGTSPPTTQRGTAYVGSGTGWQQVNFYTPVTGMDNETHVRFRWNGNGAISIYSTGTGGHECGPLGPTGIGTVDYRMEILGE